NGGLGLRAGPRYAAPKSLAECGARCVVFSGMSGGVPGKPFPESVGSVTLCAYFFGSDPKYGFFLSLNRLEHSCESIPPRGADRCASARPLPHSCSVPPVLRLSPAQPTPPPDAASTTASTSGTTVSLEPSPSPTWATPSTAGPSVGASLPGSGSPTGGTLSSRPTAPRSPPPTLP